MDIQAGTQQLRMLIPILAKNIKLFDKVNASCCGVTVGQFQIIAEIGLAKAISLNQLAANLNLDTSTMSRNVNTLVEQGYVQRNADNEDRRYIKLVLTDKGDQMNKYIDKQVSLFYHQVLQSIPVDKRAQVMESLELLINAIDESKCC